MFYKCARVSVGTGKALGLADADYATFYKDSVPIQGLIPVRTKSTLKVATSLEEELDKKRKGQGISLLVGWKTQIPLESWSEPFKFENGYDLVVHSATSLPHPASFKTPEALIASFFGSLNKHLIEAADQAVDPQDLLVITYDPSTKKFMFRCGRLADYVRLELSKNTAALFGFDGRAKMEMVGNRRFRPDAPPTWVEVNDGSVTYLADPRTGDPSTEGSIKLTKMLREGIPYLEICSTCPSSVSSPYPAQLSLGVDKVYVETDLIDEQVWVGNSNRNCLAVVPIKHEEKGYNLYTPPDAPYVKINKRQIDSIRLGLKDFTGKRIKLASDTSTVIAHLHFTRFK